MPGLWAVGEISGGFFAFNYPGGAGLPKGAVFGRIAGREAAQKAKEVSIGWEVNANGQALEGEASLRYAKPAGSVNRTSTTNGH